VVIRLNKLPRVIEEKQALQRQETVNKVLRAINDLSNEGANIRIKDLIEYTGLSRSTFAKQHVRDILIDKGIVESKKERSKIKTNKPTRISNLMKKSEERETYIKKLETENAEYKNECELLRGRLFLLMQRLKNIEK
jgi:Mn-dependent DtxR family transcriptional regulator